MSGSQRADNRKESAIRGKTCRSAPASDARFLWVGVLAAGPAAADEPKPAGAVPWSNPVPVVPPGADGPFAFTNSLVDPPDQFTGWYTTLDIGLLKPHLKSTLTIDPNLLPAGFAGVAPQAVLGKLDATFAPRLGLGYRFDGGAGEILLRYRLLGTEGTNAVGGFDAAGGGRLRSRLNLNVVDIDYVLPEFITPEGIDISPAFSRNLVAGFGVRTVTGFFDTDTQGQQILDQRASRVLAGLGPRMFVDYRRPLPLWDEPLWVYARLDAAGLFVRSRDSFETTATDGLGGQTVGGYSSRSQWSGTGTVAAEAGFSWAPQFGDAHGPADARLHLGAMVVVRPDGRIERRADAAGHRLPRGVQLLTDSGRGRGRILDGAGGVDMRRRSLIAAGLAAFAGGCASTAQVGRDPVLLVRSAEPADDDPPPRTAVAQAFDGLPPPRPADPAKPAGDDLPLPRAADPAKPADLPPPRPADPAKPAAKPDEVAAPKTSPAATVFATTAADGKPALTLEYLEEVALHVNPILRRDAAQVESSRGQAVQAGLFPNPRFDTNNPWTFSGRNSTMNVGFQQEIPVMGKKKLDQSAALEGTRQQELTAVQDKFALLTGVRQQFYAVLADQRRVEVLTEMAASAKGAYEAGVKKKKAGDATGADVLLLEIDAQLVGARLRGAEAILDGDRKQLGAVVGRRGWWIGRSSAG